MRVVLFVQYTIDNGWGLLYHPAKSIIGNVCFALEKNPQNELEHHRILSF